MRRLGLVLAAALASVAAAGVVTVNTVAPGASVTPPRFEVDPAWPKPLPNGWIMGQAAGVAVDRHDHVWVVQRPKSPAPPVLQFDGNGNLLSSWGGPGRGPGWPGNEHGIYVDHQDHVWLAGNGRRDGQVFKFTKTGQPVLTIGMPNVTGDDPRTGRTAATGAPTAGRRATAA